MKHCLFLLLFLGSVVCLRANEFSPIQSWKKEFPGVWTAKIGEPAEEQSWTALAAEKPRVNALNNLSEVEFPYSDLPIDFIETDGRIGVSIPISVTSKVYGLGLHFEGAERRQGVYVLQGQGHSIPVPFFVTDDGVGIFFDTAKVIRLRTHLSVRKDAKAKPVLADRDPVGVVEGAPKWTDVPRSSTIEAEMHAKGLRIFVISGDSILDIVSRYNLLSGGGALPPLWGLGVYQQMPSESTADQVLSEVAEYEKYNIPLDTVGLSSGWMSSSSPCTYEWRKERFPSPGSFIQSLVEKQIHLNLWENPYLSSKSQLSAPMLPLSGSHLVWNGMVPDLYLPESVKLLTEQHLSAQINVGVSGYQIDDVAGPDKWFWPLHATFPSGISAESMRQTLSTVYHKTYYDQIFKKRNQRTYGLTSSMGGSASGYPTVLKTRSPDQGKQVAAISSASISGLLWSPQLQSADSSKEWLQNAELAAFSPLTVVDSAAAGKKPWSYGAQGTKGLREAFQLRLKLLPYLYSAFADYHRKGIPPFRSMILENTFQPDAAAEEAHNWESQYMMGANILVAPYDGSSNSRSVSLPRGKWYDFYSGELVVEEGGVIETSGERIPLFVKGGAMIPMLSDTIQNTSEAYGKSLEIRVYGDPQPEQALWIYEDDGKTFNYIKGAYRYRIIKFHKDGEPSVDIQGEGPALYGEELNVKLMTR